ncbi:MAG: hypothetical protein LBO74_04735 [Candidatus Symbiothrix sp.]|jgi:hypothetical protein|nr:hypothetical protein [Candidatus Symbiothrix sp.]
MKYTFLLLLICCAPFIRISGQSVDVENLGNITKNKPVTLNGGLSAGSVFYAGNQQGRQDWTYYLNGNLNISLFGQINIPVSLNFNNLGADFSYPSLPNRFSFHPTYKWATAHIGDVSMTFSPYTLNGHLFTGGGIDLTPGKFKISAMGGRLLRKVAYSPEQPSILPNYERIGYGLKTEYDTEKYAVGMVYFQAQDRKEERMGFQLDSLGVLPAKNTALSWNVRLNLINNLTLIGEYAVSLFTRDSRDSKASTNVYDALNIHLNYQLFKNTIGIGFERIDPDYQTLGAYYFNNDYENITLNFARPFLKDDKANMALSFGYQRDDLENQKEENTNRYVASVNLNYTPMEDLQTSLNFSTFQSYRNIKSQFDYINEISPYDNLDTLNFTQLSQNLDASVMYVFQKSETKNQRLTINLSYQEAADRQGGISLPGNVSRFANSSLGYGLSFLPQGIHINSSLNASYNYGGAVESITIGPMVGATAQFLKKTLMTGFSTSYNINRSQDDIRAKVLNMRVNASYRIKKKHNMNASLVWQNRDIINRDKTDAVTTTLTYSYSF